MKEERQRITLLSRKDLEISWYSGGPGAGGQYRNKHDNCCRIFHPASGARAQSSAHRSQQQNLQEAFDNLVKTPKLKFWLSLKIREIREQETFEESVEKEMAPHNLKFEVKMDGKWVEVPAEFFV